MSGLINTSRNIAPLAPSPPKPVSGYGFETLFSLTRNQDAWVYSIPYDEWERTDLIFRTIHFFLLLIFIYIFAFASFDSYTVHYTIVFLRDKQTNIQLHLFHSSTGEFCSFYCHCVTDTMLCSSAHISFKRSVTLFYIVYIFCLYIVDIATMYT